MNVIVFLFAATLVVALPLVGCAQHYAIVDLPTDANTIQVNGFGAIVPRAELTHAQQRLMAMRASRVDAYRNLVERVYGLEVAGNSTVQQLAADHDQVRLVVRHTVRGARVVDIALVDDNTYQTKLELQLDRHFFSCVNFPAECGVPPPVSVHAPSQATIVDCSEGSCTRPFDHQAPHAYARPNVHAPSNINASSYVHGLPLVHVPHYAYGP